MLSTSALRLTVHACIMMHTATPTHTLNSPLPIFDKKV